MGLGMGNGLWVRWVGMGGAVMGSVTGYVWGMTNGGNDK